MHNPVLQMPGHGNVNFLSRMDPRVKIFCAFGFLMINLSARGPGLPALILLFCTVLFMFSGVSFREVRMRLIIPALGAVMVLVTQIFWAGGESLLFDQQILGFHVIGTLEGLHKGTKIAAQVLAGVSLVLLLSMTTPSHKFLQGVRWFRCPEIIIELAVLMLRYIFLLLEEGSRIREAQRVRLGFASSRKALRSSATLGGMLFIRAYDRAGRSLEAMQCRGYRGTTVPVSNAREGGGVFPELLVVVLVLAVFYLLR